jgi:FlaA1/EpsC-like NDP-sugar epimerase
MASQGSQGHNSQLFGIALSIYDPVELGNSQHSQGTHKMSDKKFSGKVVVVTGATSGIGHACAMAFANEGAKVVCVGRKEEALKEVAEEVRNAGIGRGDHPGGPLERC